MIGKKKRNSVNFQGKRGKGWVDDEGGDGQMAW